MDRSFNPETIARQFRRGDLYKIPHATLDAYREEALQTAVQIASNGFGATNPLRLIHLNKKPAYRALTLGHDLVIRKLSENLRALAPRSLARGRAFISSSVAALLAEGVPFRVYRLDVTAYYESFQHSKIHEQTDRINELAPQSKALLLSLLSHYSTMGGLGVPRGMSIGAVISELMMADFDKQCASLAGVYFYTRYVDDILIISCALEQPHELLSLISERLPAGLNLNPEKQSINTIAARSKKISPAVELAAIQYLGYAYRVSDSRVSYAGDFRSLQIDISDNKIKRTKFRIIRSFLAFVEDKNFDLLYSRIRFLTSNFHITDKATGRKRLAGIYFGYSELTPNCDSLIELDKFIRHAVLCKSGRIFSRSAPLLDDEKKTSLLKLSFQRGHSKKTFAYFSTSKISKIQKCWNYA